MLPRWKRTDQIGQYVGHHRLKNKSDGWVNERDNGEGGGEEVGEGGDKRGEGEGRRGDRGRLNSQGGAPCLSTQTHDDITHWGHTGGERRGEEQGQAGLVTPFDDTRTDRSKHLPRRTAWMDIFVQHVPVLSPRLVGELMYHTVE